MLRYTIVTLVVAVPLLWQMASAGCGGGTYHDPQIIDLMKNFTPGTVFQPSSGRVIKRPDCSSLKSNMVKRIIFNVIGYVVAFFPLWSLVIPSLYQPAELGIEECADSLVTYVDTLLEQRIPQEALLKLKGQQDVLKRLAGDVDKYCYGCSDRSNSSYCIPTCHPNYRRSLLTQYDTVRLDKYQLLRPLTRELWSGYFLQEYCNIQFVSAMMAMKASQSTSRDSYILFLKHLQEDSQTCMKDASAWLDESINSMAGDSAKMAVVNRAVVWQDLQTWLTSFNSVTNWTNSTSAGTSGLVLRQGSKIMIRDLTRPAPWLSCRSTCTWDNRPEFGPKYNETDPDAATRFSYNTFTVFRLGDDSVGDPIKTHETIQLKSGYSSNYIAWRMSNCYLEFYEATGAQNNYVIEAWDWTGQRRPPGQPISDRDWIVLFYDNPPDYKQLSSGRGLYYIEGLVFLNL